MQLHDLPDDAFVAWDRDIAPLLDARQNPLNPAGIAIVVRRFGDDWCVNFDGWMLINSDVTVRWSVERKRWEPFFPLPVNQHSIPEQLAMLLTHDTFRAAAIANRDRGLRPKPTGP